MNTPARPIILSALAMLVSACTTPPVSHHAPATAPDGAVTSAASGEVPGSDNPIPWEMRGRAGNAGYIPPEPRETPPHPITRTPPNPSFNATAFETSGSAPGIRAQYEAAAAAYRQSAAQSGSPEREQYLEAARKLDQQAAALGN